MVRVFNVGPSKPLIAPRTVVSVVKALHVLFLREVTAAVCVLLTLVMVALKVFREACSITRCVIFLLPSGIQTFRSFKLHYLRVPDTCCCSKKRPTKMSLCNVHTRVLHYICSAAQGPRCLSTPGLPTLESVHKERESPSTSKKDPSLGQ